ncbi:MAG: OPT/YSL family transporter, partial [Candidatus Weimeria sp.]|nr:OPT/YSL family transporter [Candidatus Weimeria sp.]
EIGAPQATLMKMIIEGVMGGKLPWNLVIIGAVLAIVVEVLGIPVLPFAIGVYLPVQLSACIMVGGIVRWFFDCKKYKDEKEKTKTVNRGILFCSGMIAGEGLVGILLALLAIAGATQAIDFSGIFADNLVVSLLGSAVVFAFIILVTAKVTAGKKNKA